MHTDFVVMDIKILPDDLNEVEIFLLLAIKIRLTANVVWCLKMHFF